MNLKKPLNKPKKHPDADQVAKELREESEALRLEREEKAKAELQAAIEEREERITSAKKVLSTGVIEAAQVVAECINLPRHGLSDEEARAYKYKLDAAKYNLKLHGLEVSVVELTGKNGSELFKPLELSRGGL